MKKILIFLLCLVMAVAMFSLSIAAEEELVPEEEVTETEEQGTPAEEVHEVPPTEEANTDIVDNTPAEVEPNIFNRTLDFAVEHQSEILQWIITVVLGIITYYFKKKFTGTDRLVKKLVDGFNGMVDAENAKASDSEESRKIVQSLAPLATVVDELKKQMPEVLENIKAEIPKIISEEIGKILAKSDKAEFDNAKILDILQIAFTNSDLPKLYKEQIMKVYLAEVKSNDDK